MRCILFLLVLLVPLALGQTVDVVAFSPSTSVFALGAYPTTVTVNCSGACSHICSLTTTGADEPACTSSSCSLGTKQTNPASVSVSNGATLKTVACSATGVASAVTQRTYSTITSASINTVQGGYYVMPFSPVVSCVGCAYLCGAAG